jgi:uncharacterized membrane protein YedE/YeeE
MPLWLKAVLGALFGTALGGALAFGACALFVMARGGWSQQSETFLVSLLVYGSIVVLGGAAVGFALGLALVLHSNRTRG